MERDRALFNCVPGVSSRRDRGHQLCPMLCPAISRSVPVGKAVYGTELYLFILIEDLLIIKEESEIYIKKSICPGDGSSLVLIGWYPNFALALSRDGLNSRSEKTLWRDRAQEDLCPWALDEV